MTKREQFIQDWIGGTIFPEHLYAALDAVIAEAIAEHEQKAWKKYPENEPKLGGRYLWIDRYSEMIVREWFGSGSLSKEWADDYAIAFRELPNPPQGGGTR